MFQLGSAEAWSVDAKARGLSGPDLSTWPVVISSQAISKDVWVVLTQGNQTSSSQQKFLVIANNGDVICRTDSAIPQDGVRPDWDAYVKEASPRPILTYVRTKDSYAFPNGISRGWLERIRGNSESTELQNVAERAVLSSCSLSGISGSKLSATQMEAEWLNYPGPISRAASQRLELFLPESHQVLSVHLPPPPFHPALAVVTRGSGESIIVLRETGQTVGLEDCGVVALWQGILGCDEGKNVDYNRSEGFWTGWEERIQKGGED